MQKWIISHCEILLIRVFQSKLSEHTHQPPRLSSSQSEVENCNLQLETTSICYDHLYGHIHATEWRKPT